MFDESNILTLEDAKHLQAWTNAWFEAAVELGFIRWPYVPDKGVVKRLHGYFNAGLMPMEAAQACFAAKH